MVQPFVRWSAATDFAVQHFVEQASAYQCGKQMLKNHYSVAFFAPVEG
jgi:hypothetical protein